MRRSRYALLALALVTTFLGGQLFQQYGLPFMSKISYVKLAEPLLLQADGELKNYHMLPAGTALYQDQSFAEGHTRYIVYINVKGAIATEQAKSDKANLIDPIWAYPVQADDVSRLLADAPVSKDDLVRVLKARKMTREELAQIAREWQD